MTLRKSYVSLRLYLFPYELPHEASFQIKVSTWARSSLKRSNLNHDLKIYLEQSQWNFLVLPKKVQRQARRNITVKVSECFSWNIEQRPVVVRSYYLTIGFLEVYRSKSDWPIRDNQYIDSNAHQIRSCMMHMKLGLLCV